MAFTKRDRRAGREAMEESLTPWARALRRFSAGKTPAALKETPLEAVYQAVAQRDRLRDKLATEEGLRRSEILSVWIAGWLKLNGSPQAIPEHVEVKEGKESDAVRWLEDHREYGNKFRTSGFVFVVRVARTAHVVSYRIERTPEGDAALKLVEDYAVTRSPKR